MTGAPHSSVKQYRDLARKPHSDGTSRALLLDGAHLLVEARQSRLTIESAAFEDAVLGDKTMSMLAEELASSGTDVRIVSRKTLEAMSPVKTPSGVVAIARRSLTPLDAICAVPDALIVTAHGIQDPGNVGGVIRTTEASAGTGLVVTAETADPFGWKALRGSMGSAFRLPIARAAVTEVIASCRARGIVIAALAPRGGRRLFDIDFRGPTAILLGGEGSGLSPDVLNQADVRISIPMTPPVESLNVGVAAGLVLYEAFRQRHAAST